MPADVPVTYETTYFPNARERSLLAPPPSCVGADLAANCPGKPLRGQARSYETHGSPPPVGAALVANETSAGGVRMGRDPLKGRRGTPPAEY